MTVPIANLMVEDTHQPSAMPRQGVENTISANRGIPFLPCDWSAFIISYERC